MIAIARILAETTFTMLKNNTGYIDYERNKADIKNIDCAYFDKLESLAIKKLRDMEHASLKGNNNTIGDSANLKYNGNIKDCQVKVFHRSYTALRKSLKLSILQYSDNCIVTFKL